MAKEVLERVAPRPSIKAGNSVWFAQQVAKLEQYVRHMAEALGLDPEEAMRRLSAEPRYPRIGIG